MPLTRPGAAPKVGLMNLLERASNRAKYTAMRAGILARALLPSTRTAYFKDLYSANNDPWNLDAADPQRTAWKYDWVLERLQRERYQRAFELGCGNGNFTKLLALRCDEVVASDIAPAAIEEARRRVTMANVQFQQGDIIEDVFPTERYDLILAQEVLYFVPWHKAFAVCKKLVDGLMPNGELVIAELDGGSISAMHHRVLPRLIPLVHEERVLRPQGRRVVQKTFRKPKA